MAKKAAAPAKPKRKTATSTPQKPTPIPTRGRQQGTREIESFRAPRVDPATGKTEVPGQPGAKTRRMRADGPLRVRATRMTYYEHTRRRPGDVYTLATAEHFNQKCMEWVDPAMAEKITTGREALKREHDDILQMRQSSRSGGEEPPAGRGHLDDDVI